MPSIKGIQAKAAAMIGEPVSKCAILFTPKSSHHLHNNFGSTAIRTRKRVGPGIGLEEGEVLTGMAAGLPDATSGILAVGETTVHFLKMKIGGSPVESLVQWPVDDVSFEFNPKGANGRAYRGVRLKFSDGTEVLLEGEKRWGVTQFE